MSRLLLTTVLLMGLGCGDDGLEAAATSIGDAPPNAEAQDSFRRPGPDTEADSGVERTDGSRAETATEDTTEVDTAPDTKRSDNCVPQVCDDVSAEPSKTQYPIVLAHGMGGFAQFGPLEYWAGVATELNSEGYATYTAVVDPLNGSDVRGPQLALFIDQVLACSCAPRVNLIAHSQGAIDSRYVVNVLGYGDRVASITTIAGPHAGTPLAQAILDTAPEFMDDLVDFLGWLLTEVYTESLEDPKVRAALTWCSEAHLATFQKDWPDDPAVARYSYAGRAGLFATGVPDCLGSEFPNPFEHHAVSAPMLGPWTLLGGGLGVANDGLVTVESAKWGEFLGCLPADHMQEIGLGLPQFYDHRTFYRKHAEFLVSRGH